MIDREDRQMKINTQKYYIVSFQLFMVASINIGPYSYLFLSATRAKFCPPQQNGLPTAELPTRKIMK